MTTTWYAVLTKPRAEYALHLELLLGKVAETLFLHYTAAITHGRKVTHAIRPLLPRYLFVGIDPAAQTTQGGEQHIANIENHRLVEDVLGTSQGPIAIPEPHLRDFAAHNGADHRGNIGKLSKYQRELMQSGAHIRVLMGAFQHSTGTVDVDEGDKIRVWLMMFGQPCSVPLAPSHIEATAPTGGLVTSQSR